MIKSSSILFGIGLLLTLSTPLCGQQINSVSNSTTNIPGFRFGIKEAPSGQEWQSPEDLSLNKEFPRADFFSFENKEEAKKILPENSRYWRSLDGTWKFHWSKNPEERLQDFYKVTKDVSDWDDVQVPMSWNILGIQKDGTLKYGVPIYVNQKVIFKHEVKVDDWRGGVMRTPPLDWTTYVYRNEVGAYRRNFTIPEDWNGHNIYINFDGVDSFFYLWINGQYVGFSKNSRNKASFDISQYLNEGKENTVAVEVYRNSDASFLEAQDMFRLPGIFRTVSITAKPKINIHDIVVTPDLTDGYKNGLLNIKTEIRNRSSQTIIRPKINYILYANKLYSDESIEVTKLEIGKTDFNTKNKDRLTPEEICFDHKTITIPSVQPWSAEKPYRYTLVAELTDAKGKALEIISTIVGFRNVEIKDTKAEDDEFGLAGRYFYVNGKPVKLKGVNRHETNPQTGKVISREQMESEIKLMKRANINHVRNSHYPDDPYWYYLCDKYGIYLEDEANIESHQYYYGEQSISHPPEWKNAHVARNMEMVHAHINHPSIVIWSLGNEAGPGKNFVAAYDAIKRIDQSRPVQYERNNSIVDIGSNQYPSIAWVQSAVKGQLNLKYPFHISEYAHSMGNASGNLIDYWDAIESTNFFMGGAIWDWIDQSMYYYDKNTGERFFAYGGNFGDVPNDGTFVNNGLIFADLQPKPAYFEVKKVYQNVAVKPINIETGKIEIFNKNYFAALDDYLIEWSLYQDGTEIKRSTDFEEPLPHIAPRQKAVLTLPLAYHTLDTFSEYFVKIEFKLKKDKLWAQKGYVQMDEQILVKNSEHRPPITEIITKNSLEMKKQDHLQIINGENFHVAFDNNSGTIFRLLYGQDTIIREGEGPKLDTYRAPVDNDNWAYQRWFENGLHDLHHRVISKNDYIRSDGSIILSFIVESQALQSASLRGGTSGSYTIVEHEDKPFTSTDFKFTSHQVWTIYQDGSIEIAAAINSSNPELALARLGFGFQMPKQYSAYTYYGRGPHNNYNDRKTSQYIEVHQSTVKDQFVPWPNPQSMSNNEDVRWTALSNDSGDGALFLSKSTFSSSALPWNELELTLATHPYKLPQSTCTHVHIDASVTGLGGNSCGQGPPLEEDRTKATPTSFGFMIRPLKANDWKQKSQVSFGGDTPIQIFRNKKGEITVSGEKTDEPILFQINGHAPKEYTQPILARDSIKIKAWYNSNKDLSSEHTFPKIDAVPIDVIFASSEETQVGSAKNMTDGNPNTIWHTMYSVTVAQYPHWIDFDAGEEKSIKGFKYLPRQDGGSNGNIKGYQFQVSLDGKKWSDIIVKGEFAGGSNVKTVLLDKPLRARYFRFTALSSHDGQDFASGAEFTIIEE